MTEALWYLGRGTGIVALVLFTLTMVLGITTRSGRRAAGLDRSGVADLHRVASLTGTALIGVHVATLMFDPYAQLRLLDVVVPFAGAFKPVWQGLGTTAFDVLVLVVVTSLLRHRIGPRAFRLVHGAAYLMWPLALAHGLGNGTDAGSWWFRAVALVCAGAVAAAVVWRTSTSYAERGHQRVPRRPSPVPLSEELSR